MKIEKILILENDIEHQGLPDQLQDIVESNKEIKFDVWWWFGEDVRQNSERSFKRFSQISKDDVFLLTYPSFVGWNNTFEEKLLLFKKLKDVNIKLKIGILFYKDFYWFVLKWLTDFYEKREIKKNLVDLQEVLLFHEIYCLDWYPSIFGEKPLVENLKRLTWEWLSENYFVSGEKIKVKSNGEIRTIWNVFLRPDDPENNKVGLEKRNGRGYTSEDLFLNEIEKYENEI